MKTNEFFLVSYLGKEQVQEVLDAKLKQIDKYAYILHDKDTYDTDSIDKDTGEILHAKGDVKSHHIHIYLKLLQSREASEIRRWFTRQIDGQTVNCLSQRVIERKGALAYLTHTTEKSKHKHQYDLAEVVKFNCDSPNDDDFDCCDNTYEIIKTIVQGARTLDLVKRYGRAYVYHRYDFKSILDELSDEELNELKGE